MKRVALLAAVSLFGCGSADFGGHWKGGLFAPMNCSDGSSANWNTTEDWVVSQSGNSLSMAGNGPCGVLSASASGDTAQLSPKTCTPVTANSAVETEQLLSGGTVKISGDTMTVVAPMAVAISSGSGSGSCSGTLTGTLARQ